MVLQQHKKLKACQMLTSFVFLNNAKQILINSSTEDLILKNIIKNT